MYKHKVTYSSWKENIWGGVDGGVIIKVNSTIVTTKN